MRPFSYAKDLRGAFVAHMAARLDARLCAQSSDVFEARGIKTPVTSSSIMVFLSRSGPGTISDICRIDGQSHQLATSRLAPLLKLKLVEAGVDPKDGRRQLLRLTAKGRTDAKKLESAAKDIAKALTHLGKDIGVDILEALERTDKELAHIELIDRVEGSSNDE